MWINYQIDVYNDTCTADGKFKGNAVAQQKRSGTLSNHSQAQNICQLSLNKQHKISFFCVLLLVFPKIFRDIQIIFTTHIPLKWLFLRDRITWGG